MDYLFQKLTENIKSHSNVILMTHKHPDLDGMGSAIGLYKIIKELKKECYVVKPTSKIDFSLEKAFQLIESNNMNIKFMEYPNLLNIVDDNSLLIVLDVQKPELVECKQLLEKIKDVFVIDHHMNTSVHIENTVFEYINSNKSSVVEIIVDYLKYLNKSVDFLTATLMSAGMEIDTHSYQLKTNDATFRAASALARMGVDLTLKNELLKESMEDVIRRHDYIKNSYYIKEGYLLCDMGAGEINETVDLAILADELLRLDGVQVSFAVGKIEDNTVGVSARSMGKVSVEVIMSALGGGGHVTDAAATFENKSNAEVIEMIKKVVMEG